jgi:actin-related protein
MCAVRCDVVCSEKDLRAFAPSDFPVTVTTAANPVLATWSGGSHWAADHSDAVLRHCITKADYEEFGSELCARTFFW